MGEPTENFRTWEMFGGRMTERGRMHVAASARTVEMYGDEPVPVVATEDPEGAHYGWLGAAYLHYPADEFPTMIQPHEGIFCMQFPYGPESEQERGHGEIVRLRVTDVQSVTPTPQSPQVEGTNDE